MGAGDHDPVPVHQGGGPVLLHQALPQRATQGLGRQPERRDGKGQAGRGRDQDAHPAVQQIGHLGLPAARHAHQGLAPAFGNGIGLGSGGQRLDVAPPGIVEAQAAHPRQGLCRRGGAQGREGGRGIRGAGRERFRELRSGEQFAQPCLTQREDLIRHHRQRADAGD